MTAQDPLRMLEDEHRIIAKVVKAAPVLADRLEAGQEGTLDTFQELVAFMRGFADRCHHGKEEELLFPLLLSKGVPAEGCPLGALTAEHVQGRALVRELSNAIQEWKKRSPGAKNEVVQTLREIAELYPNHIWKEDYLLFPMTGKILNFGEQQDLWRRFEEGEAALDRDLHQRFERFAEELYQSTQGAPGGESGNLR